MGESRSQTAEKVKEQKPKVTHRVLNIVAEKVKKPHVAEQVHPTAVKEHGSEGSKHQFQQRHRLATNKGSVFGWYDCHQLKKRPQLLLAHRHFKQEHDHIGGDEGVGDERESL
jgi:hypothetical protein